LARKRPRGDRARSRPAQGPGPVDTLLLWTNLGISLLVLVLPGFFDLPLGKALLATLVGGVIGNLLLAIAGTIGRTGAYRRWCSTRAARPPGLVSSRQVLNVLQCFGWAIFELIVIAKAAGTALRQAVRVRGDVVLDAALRRADEALALLGPIGFVRRYVRKLAIWAVAASLAYLTWWILDGAGGPRRLVGQGPPRLVLGRRSTS
jgi:NCS1 family nucleobase:cation symporter-1